MDLSFDILAMLALVATIAGFLDAMAGGGGLLTIPALLMANVPTLYTLGTNKLQATVGSLSASITMIKKVRFIQSKFGLPSLPALLALR